MGENSKLSRHGKIGGEFQKKEGVVVRLSFSKKIN